MTISEGAFSILSGLLQARAGIALGREKAYLLDTRLGPIAQRHGCATVDGLAAALTARDEALSAEIVEAMVNHETFFFRDNTPFAMLRDAVFPALRRSRHTSRSVRIWSAAASTGQEPYSLAMMVADDPAWAGWRVEIVATELSRRALARAEAGVYSQFEVQRGLPIQSLVRHFAQEGDGWRLDERIRRMVRFEPLNLCKPFGHLGSFDVVLCRNVLMYFDLATKADVLSRLRRQLAPDGTLVLGAAETVLGLSTDFEPDWSNRGLYRAAA